MASTSTPVRAVAFTVAGLDTVLLLIAGILALDTFNQIAESGDEGLVSLGYLVAGLFAFVAVPSLVLAVLALLTRGAAAVACAVLSVVSLPVLGFLAVTYL